MSTINMMHRNTETPRKPTNSSFLPKKKSLSIVKRHLWNQQLSASKLQLC